MKAQLDNAYFTDAFLDFVGEGGSLDWLSYPQTGICHLKKIALSNALLDDKKSLTGVTSPICFSGPMNASPNRLIETLAQLEQPIAAGFIQTRVEENINEQLNQLEDVANHKVLKEFRTNYFLSLGADLTSLKKGMKRDSRYRVNKLACVMTKASIITEKSLKNINVFAKLYEETAKRTGFSSAYYFSEKHWHQLLSSPLFHLVLIAIDNEIVAGAILAEVPDGVDYVFMGYHKSDVDLSRLTLLLCHDYAATELVREQAHQRFYLGGGISEGDALAKFKMSMGGQPTSFVRLKFVNKDFLHKGYEKVALEEAMRGRWPC